MSKRMSWFPWVQRVSGAMALLVFIGLQPALAAPVTCPPGEPDFPYADVGNDGCFNSGVDSEITVADLFFSSSYSTPGDSSLVIPSTVKVVAGAGMSVAWHAHHIFLRGKIVTTDRDLTLSATPGGRYEITGTWKSSGSGASSATCGGLCVGAIVGDGAVVSADADVSLAGSLQLGSGAEIESNLGNVSLINLTATDTDTIVNAAGNLVLLTSPPARIGAESSLSAGGQLSVNATGTPGLELGDGVELTANDLTILFGGSLVAGSGVKIECGTIACSINNGSTRSFGDSLKITSQVPLSITGSGAFSAGTAAKITAPQISIGGGGATTFGTGAKLRATNGTLGISGPSAITFGMGAKLLATGQIDLSSGTTRTFAGGATLKSDASIVISGGGTNDLGASLKMTAPIITMNGNADCLLGSGAKIEASTGALAISPCSNTIQVGGGSKLSGVGLNLASGGSRTIGDGAKLDATTGTLNLGTGSTTTVGQDCKLSGEAISINNAGTIEIGTGSKLIAGAGGVNLNNGDAINLQGDVVASAQGDIVLSSPAARTLGAGVVLASSTGQVSLGNGGDTIIGAGSSLSGSSLSIANGGAITTAEKVSLEATANIGLSSAGAQTFQDKLNMTSGGTITVSTGNPVSFGKKAKLKAGGNISLMNGSSISFDEKAKLTSQGYITVSGPLNVSIGLGSKLNAGTNITVQSAAPGYTLTLNDKTKLKSGTLKDPMAPASVITVSGDTLNMLPGVSLAGADAINTVAIVPIDKLQVEGAKIAGKTITVGSLANAPFSSFVFHANTVKGSADPATLTFEATGTICDLTDSAFKSISVDTSSCGSVVGP